MFFIIGFVLVSASVVGGYAAAGGHLEILWQPLEFVIIFGAMFGGFIIASPKQVLGGVGKALGGTLLKGPSYTKAHYLELIGCLYAVFRVAKSKGDLALESHVEKPEDSTLFANFPKFAKDHHALEFLCDYLRMLTLGTSNAYEVEAVMDMELDGHHAEMLAISGAIDDMGQAAPAFGIVAAVLGVIHTMGSITEPPEVLGHLIGGALVGTFAGILMSYGYLGPMGKTIAASHASDAKYMEVIKAAVIAHMQGYAPQVSVEFARKIIPGNMRPTFAEVENMVQNLPTDSG
jgi:chemotaxis protein MotA